MLQTSAGVPSIMGLADLSDEGAIWSPGIVWQNRHQV